MPHPVRTFFSNAILQSLLLAFIIWAVSAITEEKLSQIEENTRNSQDMKIAMVALSTEVPKLTRTMEKFEDRPYVGEDRLTICSFYGPYSLDVFEVLEGLIDKSTKIKEDCKENILLVDQLDLMESFGIADQFIKEYKELNELIKEALKRGTLESELALDRLEQLSEEALEKLKSAGRYLGDPL